MKLIAEIGINHNGDLDITRKLIDMAKFAGFDYVKFQKRTPELCVPDEQKNVIKDTPWGKITYLDYKKKIEFYKDEYDIIDAHCKKVGIDWFASIWDEESSEFMKQYSDIVKIPSALITNKKLLQKIKEFDTRIISTGMSTEEDIETAVSISNPRVIMHTNSCYPSPIEDLNLKYILRLQRMYPDAEIGYSGHEFGLDTTYAAVALGATWIERHITLDRFMWGSDQLSSVEPVGMIKMVKAINGIERALGTDEPRKISKSELYKKQSLRGSK